MNYFRPSSPFVLEYVHEPPFEPNQFATIEILSTDAPSSSTSITPQPTVVSPSPTLLLEFVILKEVCENIFKDLNKLVQTRSNFVHQKNYEDEWTTLGERIDYMMCELQKLSLEAHNQALNTLNNWFKDVVTGMDEMEDTRNQEKRKLYISDTPIYLDASSIITTSVHYENPDFKWLTKLKLRADAPILEKLKKDSEQEQRIKKLEKDLFEQRMMYANLQRRMTNQQEDSKVRKEALVKGYKDLKEAMEKQSDKMTNMMREMMELMKKQVNP